MNNLAVHISNYLAVVEKVIELDPPELPEWSNELSDRTTIVTKTYTLPDMDVEGAFDGEEIVIPFYADTQYNEGFYAFIGTDIEVPVELTDGGDPTFGDIAGFRIYLDGEE
jgi:hypothetical protein